MPASKRSRRIRLDRTTLFDKALRLAEARDLFWYRRDARGFGGWVEDRLAISSSTAYDLVHVAELIAARQMNVSDASDTFGTLPAKAIYLIAAPSTPETARDEVLERAKVGEHLSYATVAEVVEKAKNAITVTSGMMAATEAPGTATTK